MESDKKPYKRTGNCSANMDVSKCALNINIMKHTDNTQKS